MFAGNANNRQKDCLLDFVREKSLNNSGKRQKDYLPVFF